VRVIERLFIDAEGPAHATTELAFPALLGGYLRRVTLYREHLGAPVVERVVPDGCMRLVFDLREGRADVAGAATGPVCLHLDATIESLTVTLRPGAAELLGLPARELRDQCVPLGWQALARRLTTASDDAARAGMLGDALLQRLRATSGADRSRVQRACRLLVEQQPIGRVARAVGVGERRLQQLFDLHVGLSPVRYRRLARLHRCLASIGPEPDWAALAYAHGFADQSHLSRELRALVGLTPTELVSGPFKSRG